MSANKIKVLILGQTGMLGNMVMRVLKKNPELKILGTQINNRVKPNYFDVLEGVNRLDQIFKKHNGFDYCINCIGLTNNKINKNVLSSVRKARLINAMFPKQLAVIARLYNCKIIHISTDGVFKGTKRNYDEKSKPDCNDIYGQTKLKGEVDADNVLNIRCSIIGPSPYEHGGVWEWMSDLPMASSVDGFVNHIWNGVTTLQFSLLCQAIILKDKFVELRRKSNLYHFVPNRPLSKFALLRILKDCLNKNGDVYIKKSVQGKGTISRILKSVFRDMQELVPYGMSIRKAINQLLEFERKKDG